MADLWYPTNDEDCTHHLAVSMAPEGLRWIRTLCGIDTIPLGEGEPMPKVPQPERCMACLMRHGEQLADRREAKQPERIVGLAQLLAAGLDNALEGAEDRRQIEEGGRDG